MTTSATKNMKRRQLVLDDHSAHHEEGWIFSYADMITILMTFFILMLSISNVSPEKYEQLKSSVSKSTKVTPAAPSANLQAQDKKSQNAILAELQKSSKKGAPTLAGIPLDSVARKAAETGGDRMAQLAEGMRILMSAADKNFIEQDIHQIADFEKLKTDLNKLLKATENQKESEKRRPLIVVRFPYEEIFLASDKLSAQGIDFARQLSVAVKNMETRPWVKIELEPSPAPAKETSPKMASSLRYGSILVSEFAAVGIDQGLISVGVRPPALPETKAPPLKYGGWVKITIERRPKEIEKTGNPSEGNLHSGEKAK